MEYCLQEYKGIWWMYNAPLNRWVLSSDEDYSTSNIMHCGGDRLITDCFHIFREWMRGNTPFDY